MRIAPIVLYFASLLSLLLTIVVIIMLLLFAFMGDRVPVNIDAELNTQVL
jgi:hypothetical protein